MAADIYGGVCSKHFGLIADLLLTTTLGEKSYYSSSHFTQEETEAWRI